MSQQAIIKRYYLIIDKLRKQQYPSRKEITSVFEEEGLKCSRRTFNRTLESLRVEFGIEVTYSSYRKGYFIDREKSINYDSFSDLLNYYNSTENLSQALTSANKSLQFIQIDSSSLMQGLGHLPYIVTAINNQVQIQLTYCKFDENGTEPFLYNPELLKEYQNRWYVVGYAHHRKAIRTYALDRIQKLEIISTSFSRKLGRADEYFKNVIGVNTSGKNIIEIVLSFTPQQGNYIRTLPLHNTQNVLFDTDKEFRISIKVKPNYELKQHIQMYGDNVKIIHPENLIELCK